MDVAFYEVFEEEKEAIKKYLNPRIKAAFYSATIQEGGHKKPPAAIISVRTQSIIPENWSQKLKVILTRSQGYDHVLAYVKKTGFKGHCGYLENYCARSVAEHAVMCMLALWRKLKQQLRQFDTFDREGLTGRSCKHKNAAVVGVGHIGAQIIDVLKGLKMNVRGVDIVPRVKGLEYVSLQKAISWADVIFCTLPLTRQTKGMLNYGVLKRAKPRGIFINVSRAEISPAVDLKRLMDEGILEGLSLDIYEEEGILAPSLRSGRKSRRPAIKAIMNLRKRSNTMLTPHNAFNDEEALEQKARRSAESINDYFKSGRFPHPVPTHKLIA